MQLSLRIKGPDAKAVSYLLAKNPDNLYERGEKGLTVRLVYPVFTDEEVQVLIYVKPDSIDLVKNSPDFYDISHYINDREFAASSIFVTSLRKALGTALNGKPREEYLEWVDHPFEMELSFGPVASDLSNQELEALFQPIGYQVNITCGKSMIRTKSSARFITLKGMHTIQHALRHISILIPVIDNYKHYFIDEREIEKLDRYGEGWLETHPCRELILKRTLRFQNMISQSQFYQKGSRQEEKLEEKKARLNDLRYEAILDAVKSLSFRGSIVDLGAGEGKLSVQLGFVEGVKELLSVEPSNRARLRAMERFEQLKDKQGFLMPVSAAGSLFYYDERLNNQDVIILCEVIEHIDEYRLPNIFNMLLRDNQPRVLIVTTPNQEYNVVYDMNETMRHLDHRFEWKREEFRKNCLEWAAPHSYQVVFQGIGEEHTDFGHPTQMAIFSREEGVK